MLTESGREDVAMSADDPEHAVYTVIAKSWEKALAVKTAIARELGRVGFKQFEHGSPYKIPGSTTGYAVFFVVKIARR